MTLDELIRRLIALRERGMSGDDSVVIATMNPGVPTNMRVDVHHVVRGGDWDDGRILLVPQKALVIQKLTKQPIRDEANDRLIFLRQAYKKAGQDYDLPKAREGAWVDGFVEGARMFFTGER